MPTFVFYALIVALPWCAFTVLVAFWRKLDPWLAEGDRQGFLGLLHFLLFFIGLVLAVIVALVRAYFS